MGLKDTIRHFPNSPGVYIMKDAKGRAIYIGKARSLKKRVSSYFAKDAPSSRIGLLVSVVKSIDYLPTNTEAEALIYEAGLIKSEKPKFNVELKDDKSYPYLKLTVNEEYPRLFITRKKEKDGAAYYGPYTDVKLLRQALVFIRSVFPLRVCKKFKPKLCTSYHILECLGPCEKKVDKDGYCHVVNEVKLFLEGKNRELFSKLSRRMEEASEKLNFETAARIRDQIRGLSTVVTKRSVPSPMDQIDELKYVLNLKRRPKRIEAFDISNISGKKAVGSMVSFYNGKPDKNNYRKFKIKTVAGVDDYKMMREVIRRRYTRLLNEKKILPDLIIIDGGKGHLASALNVLHALGVDHIPAVGIAKEFENIYLPKRRLPIVLPKDSSILQLIRSIRDEAHRFAKRYHIILRRKDISASGLDGIKGIGAARKKNLFAHFTSIDNIKNAGLDDLLKVKGIDEKTARRIIQYFKKKRV